jgi:hypothetical protein
MRSLVMLCCAALAALALCAPPAAAQTVGYLYTNNNSTPNTVSAFAVQANGDLAAVAGSPFLTGGSPGFCTAMDTVAIDTLRRRLYLTNGNSNNVSGLNVSGNGALTPISGSPFATRFTGIALNPAGTRLFTHANSNQLRSFTINTTLGLPASAIIPRAATSYSRARPPGRSPPSPLLTTSTGQTSRTTRGCA